MRQQAGCGPAECCAEPAAPDKLSLGLLVTRLLGSQQPLPRADALALGPGQSGSAACGVLGSNHPYQQGFVSAVLRPLSLILWLMNQESH